MSSPDFQSVCVVNLCCKNHTRYIFCHTAVAQIVLSRTDILTILFYHVENLCTLVSEVAALLELASFRFAFEYFIPVTLPAVLIRPLTLFRTVSVAAL